MSQINRLVATLEEVADKVAKDAAIDPAGAQILKPTSVSSQSDAACYGR